jgi:hypothetical protein
MPKPLLQKIFKGGPHTEEEDKHSQKIWERMNLG